LMCGLNAEYAPNIIMICVAAFFAASVRAPLTAITLTLELTASFTNLLPTAVAVAVAAMIAGAAKTEPLYERMMESMQAEANKINEKHLTSATITGTITALSPALGKRIRDVFWPY
ncbi:MAG: chloride channel protein, partial [Clostridia bacterium]|nr:chloride channel protein [Clostridia bacterium]